MKFSIVTPTYNMAQYLPETIESVLSQTGDFALEYIVVDGGSNDGTVELLKKYEQQLEGGARRIDFRWISEKDGGMYDAINKGFAMAVGDIYAWLNADDIYEPGALNVVARAFEAFPDIDWLKGITTNVEEDGAIIRKGMAKIYDQKLIARGVYGRQAYFVEQDSVFWRAELWRKAGGIPKEYKLAGDYWLWKEFAKYATLWSLNVPVSRFRKRKEQLSQRVTAYKAEQEKILRKTGYEFSLIHFFFTAQSRLGPRFSKLFQKLYPLLFMRKKKIYFIDMFDGKMIRKDAALHMTENRP